MPWGKKRHTTSSRRNQTQRSLTFRERTLEWDILFLWWPLLPFVYRPKSVGPNVAVRPSIKMVTAILIIVKPSVYPRGNVAPSWGGGSLYVLPNAGSKMGGWRMSRAYSGRLRMLRCLVYVDKMHRSRWFAWYVLCLCLRYHPQRTGMPCDNHHGSGDNHDLWNNNDFVWNNPSTGNDGGYRLFLVFRGQRWWWFNLRTTCGDLRWHLSAGKNVYLGFL